MRVALTGPPEAIASWRDRLRRLGAEIRDDGAAGEITLTLLIDPPATGIGARLARLDGAGASPVAVLSDDETLAPACALIGALLLPLGMSDAHLGLVLRFAGRLAGEASRRHTLEGRRDTLESERRALRGLAPFEADAMTLGTATGRYRAQRLLAGGPGLVMIMAIDELASWTAAFGRDAGARTETAVAGILVAAPGRLGDILHSRGPGAGWGLWLAGQDRAAASAIALRLLDMVVAGRLFHDRSRSESAVTLSIGIAAAPAEGAALAAEALAEQALAHAAALGGNRIRWTG